MALESGPEPKRLIMFVWFFFGKSWFFLLE
jgi:hypothetical protein